MAWTETINFTNDSMNARSRDAFATAYGWSATLPDGTTPNPETKAQHRARRIKEFIKETTKAEENKVAHAAIVPPVTQN